MDEPTAGLPEQVLAHVRNIYSEKVIAHAMNPRNVGEIPDADGYGSAVGACNDSMEIWLRVRGGLIREARFWTEGCAETIAAGSALTEMARGRSPLEALRIQPADVIAALDGLPPESRHCAALAVNALREAIKDHLEAEREPWKKLYRTGIMKGDRMVERARVEEILSRIMLPATMRSIMDLNLLRSIHVKDHRLKVTLSNAALSPEMREMLTREIQDRLRGQDGIEAVAVDFEEAQPKDLNQVGKVVAVMSGKGGVGKSLVTALVAVAMAREGKSVGILDADITGPSIPKMFGVHGRPAGSESGLLPVSSQTGIQVMSINLLLPSEDEAVIWRGPLLARAIEQFWQDVLWGKLDLLVVDLPPGTGDVPLTVMQSLPLAGAIIVFSPQDLAAMVVRKAVKMAQQLKVPILGVVENMSYFVVPETGKQINIFGPSRAGEMARAAGAPVLGRIPIDPELARLSDLGQIESHRAEVTDQLQKSLSEILAAAKEGAPKDPCSVCKSWIGECPSAKAKGNA